MLAEGSEGQYLSLCVTLRAVTGAACHNEDTCPGAAIDPGDRRDEAWLPPTATRRQKGCSSPLPVPGPPRCYSNRHA